MAAVRADPRHPSFGAEELALVVAVLCECESEQNRLFALALLEFFAQERRPSSCILDDDTLRLLLLVRARNPADSALRMEGMRYMQRLQAQAQQSGSGTGNRRSLIDSSLTCGEESMRYPLAIEGLVHLLLVVPDAQFVQMKDSFLRHAESETFLQRMSFGQWGASATPQPPVTPPPGSDVEWRKRIIRMLLDGGDGEQQPNSKRHKSAAEAEGTAQTAADSMSAAATNSAGSDADQSCSQSRVALHRLLADWHATPTVAHVHRAYDAGYESTETERARVWSLLLHQPRTPTELAQLLLYVPRSARSLSPMAYLLSERSDAVWAGVEEAAGAQLLQLFGSSSSSSSSSFAEVSVCEVSSAVKFVLPVLDPNLTVSLAGLLSPHACDFRQRILQTILDAGPKHTQARMDRALQDFSDTLGQRPPHAMLPNKWARWMLFLRTMHVRLSIGDVSALTESLLRRARRDHCTAVSLDVLAWWMHESTGAPMEWLRDEEEEEAANGSSRDGGNSWNQHNEREQLAVLVHAHTLWLRTGARILRGELIQHSPLPVDLMKIIVEYVVPPPPSAALVASSAVAASFAHSAAIPSHGRLLGIGTAQPWNATYHPAFLVD
jgi:hypothetical protein